MASSGGNSAGTTHASPPDSVPIMQVCAYALPTAASEPTDGYRPTSQRRRSSSSTMRQLEPSAVLTSFQISRIRASEVTADRISRSARSNAAES